MFVACELVPGGRPWSTSRPDRAWAHCEPCGGRSPRRRRRRRTSRFGNLSQALHVGLRHIPQMADHRPAISASPSTAPVAWSIWRSRGLAECRGRDKYSEKAAVQRSLPYEPCLVREPKEIYWSLWRRPRAEAGGEHPCDRLCAEKDIDRRLIRPQRAPDQRYGRKLQPPHNRPAADAPLSLGSVLQG